MAKIEKETIILILENGDSIEVEYPTDIAEDLLEEMYEAQSKDTFWHVGNYLDAKAMYKGYLISHINMKRIVGMA